METPFTFTYIVIDKRSRDEQGNPVAGIYPFSIQNDKEAPIRILQSSIPLITAKLYSGNPYPSFEYMEAVEHRIKLDIKHNADYNAVVADQINDKEWHLHETV